MITDGPRNIRKLGMRQIFGILGCARSEQYEIRQFHVQRLNFCAVHYVHVDMIDQQNSTVTKPPILAAVPEQDIEMLVASGEIPVIDFPKYSGHTQAVKRCGKLITEASSAACGVKNKDGFIKVRLESRQIMSHFNSKSQFRAE